MLLFTTDTRWYSVTLALCCLLFVVSYTSVAQINLVPNPSFELNDTCPHTIGFQQGDRPLHWYSWFNSPEYFHSCASSGLGIDTLVGVPENGWTFQHPFDGDAYVGLYCFDAVSDDYREYVGTELLEPLQVGCTYQLSFRINPASNGNYWLIGDGSACNNVGMLFTTSSNAWTAPTAWPPGPAFPYRNFAHLRTTTPVADTAVWTLVEGTFTADSAYTHLVLGNFFPDSLTVGMPIGNPMPWTGITYYLLDEVEVLPLDTGCNGLGIEDGMHQAEPSVQWKANLITVDWLGVDFVVDILDVSGRVVLSNKVTTSFAILPFSRVSGMYILRLRSEESRFVTKFMVE